MKNIFKTLIITFLLITVFSFLLNLFIHFSFINNYIYRVLLVILIFIIIFINSYNLGKNENDKGYIIGLKYGFITILLMFLFSLLLFRNVSSYMIIYYFIIILTSTIGSIIGINIKKS